MELQTLKEGSIIHNKYVIGDCFISHINIRGTNGKEPNKKGDRIVCVLLASDYLDCNILACIS